MFQTDHVTGRYKMVSKLHMQMNGKGNLKLSHGVALLYLLCAKEDILGQILVCIKERNHETLWTVDPTFSKFIQRKQISFILQSTVNI